MASFDLNSITTALSETNQKTHGVDFTGKSLKLNNENDAKVIVDAINNCPELHYLTLTGNTLGVTAAEAIAEALEKHPEFKQAKWSDMFTGRMKTEIPPALSALGNGMITAGARLCVLDLSDNAFGPIGVEGLAKLLQSEVCSKLQELRLNNNGLGITGGRLLAKALSGDHPPRLRVFVAGRNRLENDGAKALAQVFQKMGSLEEVVMPQNGIYHVGVTALSEAFKHNPNLRSLNLNDNTVGPKGAAAIASALPKLKSLREVNFGDCLLKGKGALTLAQGFKDNAVLLEYVDLSHNEIGHEACLDVVECLTALPDSTERLHKVVLAGNSMGGATNKQIMKEKLGDCAELSDGENSDDEYVTGSEESDDDEEENSEDSATEDAQHIDQAEESIVLMDRAMAQEYLDNSVVEVETDVAKFLKYPTLSNLQCLGPDAAQVIDAHLQVIKVPEDFIEAYVEAVLKVSGLTSQDNAQVAAQQAVKLYPMLMSRVGEKHGVQWSLANSMLVGLGLIKSESKKHQIQWDLPGCYSVLGSVISENYFPSSLRETLRFFIHTKKEKMTTELREILARCPGLCS